MVKKTKEALRWIVDVLQKHKVDYRISGGVAAVAHGVSRPINDIDIIIPDKSFDIILSDVKNYITEQPHRHKDDRFDLFYMRLSYKGQDIDISGGDSGKLFDKKTGKWIDDSVDFSTSVRKNVLDIDVLVSPKNELIWYKKILDRDVDKKDVKALTE
jgi:hypothetical protein